MASVWVTLILAVVLVSFLILFREPLGRRISGSDTFEFGIGVLKFRLASSEAQRALQEFFADMKDLIDKVPPAERQRVLPVVESRDGSVRVEEIYQGFQRESKEHEYLRALRDAQFIRPVRGGRFEADKTLGLKPFGRLMLRHQREYILTGKPAQ
jgi:hypothetical protein